jgi:HD-GYP domain-containing protein (c-di-GMP phosphodiesterase class II)
VSLNNTLLQRAVSDILHSFVMVMVDAIDARSPYNANHTRSMVAYAQRFMDWLDAGDHGWRFQEKEKDPFLMSVWLHDLGKLVIPLEIMDKKSRLGCLEAGLHARLEVARLMERLRALEHPDQAAEAERRLRDLDWAGETLKKINQAGALTEEMQRQISILWEMRCLQSDGTEIPLLTEQEKTAVSVRFGTLTDRERGEIEKHVVYTRKLLSAMRFSGAYASVPEWASRHHELLNGSGYPDHLRGNELSRQVRLLTILDIYDALTAEDRPYKPPMPPERALAVLESMRDEGKVDGEILSLFKQSGAWRKETAAPRA